MVSSLQHHKLCKEKGLKKEQAICSLESIEIGVERKANETLIGKRGKKKNESAVEHTRQREDKAKGKIRTILLPIGICSGPCKQGRSL